MALNKCPECSNEVSDTAAACPKCGYVLNRATSSHDEIYRLIKDKLAQGEKIAAIKYYRECVPGTGLAEAKEAVEKIERGEPVPLPASATHLPAAGSPAQKSGCASVIVIGGLLTGGLVWTAIKLWA